MSRQSHCDDHDVVVDLERAGKAFPRFAYVLVKKTYAIGERGLTASPAEVLRRDFRDGKLDPPLPTGTDFWTDKPLTDVVVEGSAWAPGGRAIDRMIARCAVGRHVKRIAVFGRRAIEWTAGGRPYLAPPERFESIPLDVEHAYGGCDVRVPLPPIESPLDVLAAVGNHPGMYPRNPMGMGYLVLPNPVEGLEAPNLEDPDDLLTDERLVVGDPAKWHRQPAPWTLGWQSGWMFPRSAYLGVEERYPAEPHELSEVARGFLPADFRERRALGDASHARRFLQEASLGMSFAPLAAGVPIALDGVHRDRARIEFALPAAPRIEIAIERARQVVEPRLSLVAIAPDALRVSFVYYARTETLPRRFIPGIHKTIPLSARIDGGQPVHYQPPPTWDQLVTP